MNLIELISNQTSLFPETFIYYVDTKRRLSVKEAQKRLASFDVGDFIINAVKGNKLYKFIKAENGHDAYYYALKPIGKRSPIYD